LGLDSSRQKDDLERLSQLLSLANPPSVQRASVVAFERISSEDVPGILAARYREVSPAVQPQVVDTILSRDAWYPLFFNELARGTIPAASITAAQRQELVGHPTASIRERASQLFATSINADRQQVIHQYRAALGMSGDVERGRGLFTKNCSQCHKLGDVGYAVGPNLATVANKTPSFLLQELFDPNRNVDTRYASYVAATKSGLVRTGILSSESANSITLLGTEGKQFNLLRTDLEELRATGKSLMPEGIEKELPLQAVADLIAFLNSMPTPPKQLVGNVPSVVKSNQGRLGLLASFASIYGDQITFEAPFGNIGFWHGLQDHAVWTVELPKSAEFDVYLDGACDAGAAGNLFRLEIGDKAITGHIESTGGWNKYVASKVGTIGLEAGIQRVVFRPDGAAIRGALVDLRGLHFVPAGEVFAMDDKKPLLQVSDFSDVAKQILDEGLKTDQREMLIAKNPDHAAELITAMTNNMPDDLKEEYRRIPWIWRVAVACGKRDQADHLIKLLDVSLPRKGQRLRDWQAVVIGGGVINGIGLKGGWPKARMTEILRDKPDLEERWKNALTLAGIMAEEEAVNTGTRYDALRMIALDDWSLRQNQMTKYLKKGVHDELQQGAISGLSDVESSEVSKLLLSNLGHFNDENRHLALEALLRTKARTETLLDALESAQILPKQLNDTQRKTLRESTDKSIRDRAIRILGQ
jgi:putative heme-binding domain-containing protein